MSEPLNISHDCTIDLDGKTLTLSTTDKGTDDILVHNGASVTIINGNVKTANTAVCVYAGGSAVLQNCNVEANSDKYNVIWSEGNVTLNNCTVTNSSKNCDVIHVKGGTLTIEGGSYNNTCDNESTITEPPYVIGITNATVTLTNVEVNGANQGAITVNGASSVKINGGTYTAGKWYALYMSGTSNVQYENAKLNGATYDIYIDSDNCTLNTASPATRGGINL